MLFEFPAFFSSSATQAARACIGAYSIMPGKSSDYFIFDSSSCLRGESWACVERRERALVTDPTQSQKSNGCRLIFPLLPLGQKESHRHAKMALSSHGLRAACTVFTTKQYLLQSN